MPLGPQVSKLRLGEDIIRCMLVIGVDWELHDFKISILAAIMHACGPRNILVCLKKLVRCNEILNKDIIYLLLPLSLSLSLFSHISSTYLCYWHVDSIQHYFFSFSQKVESWWRWLTCEPFSPHLSFFRLKNYGVSGVGGIELPPSLLPF